MFWGKQHKEDKATPEADEQPIPRSKLPAALQTLADRDDDFYDDIYSPYSVDSTETPYRYAGYANRLRTILLSAHRYVAYTSDIGESFRPVAHPWLVRSAYGISWTYLIGDVAHEGYKAYLRNRLVLAPPCEAYKDASANPNHQRTEPAKLTPTTTNTSATTATGPDTLTPWPTTHVPLVEDYRMVMAKRAVFQSIASMGLPALTIHSVVKYSGRALKGRKSVFLRTWVPIGLGLSVVPFLPYLFDYPVEEAVEWSFRTGLRAYAGEDAVRPLPRVSHATSSGHSASVHAETGSADVDANAETPSWEEYKEERRLAKEQRKKERGEGAGVLGMLGWGDKKKKD
ncbi:hypothetical protein BO70DRAFT_347235 [Aspergillus heteromorphus CBS 117.55]|uniref:Mitochondrial fission process protein 1 n=1 Tax=Aspergillus heteromorphus CBS 117.55 TaxID=1448321 RepID=A0A317UQ06_9EURO|nr:uncharacterized protein BO70DRAFT_347235 [Aspergillus heteromorphus CBS 117.55]PWY64063.1 hypothetical protein BO70DRAFT_347235 [Aspergillus heteromorphus CBS 117.55]